VQCDCNLKKYVGLTTLIEEPTRKRHGYKRTLRACQ
jgi:hypothetical protein